MNSKLNIILYLILLNAFFVASMSAQSISGCKYIDNLEHGNKKLSRHVKERMVKMCIEENKKSHKELIENSEELAKLSKELEKSFEKEEKLSNEDKKKLKRVEKLLKKIRKELKAGKDKSSDSKNKKKEPVSTLQAIKNLQTKTQKLLVEIKKTSRYTISTAAIQSSNAVLKLVKFLKLEN